MSASIDDLVGKYDAGQRAGFGKGSGDAIAQA